MPKKSIPWSFKLTHPCPAVKNFYLKGSASVPSFGLLFGLLALGHPDKLKAKINIKIHTLFISNQIFKKIPSMGRIIARGVTHTITSRSRTLDQIFVILPMGGIFQELAMADLESPQNVILSSFQQGKCCTRLSQMMKTNTYQGIEFIHFDSLLQNLKKVSFSNMEQQSCHQHQQIIQNIYSLNHKKQ